MELRVLGPLEAFGQDGALPLGGPKQRALLAVLLLHANEVVSSDRLIDDLWGDQPPKTASAYVQNCVSRLRKVLGSEVLETRAPGYVLRIDEDEIDSRRFERLFHEARALPVAERAAPLREALSLWRGPAFADLAFEPFAQPEIGRLEELRLGAVEDRIEAELELGLHDEVVGELEAFALGHPSRERLRELQMLALYRSGRQTDALRVYQDARIALIEELGIEPGERLRALERMILAHDPGLDLPLAAPTPVTATTIRGRRTVAVLLAQLEQPEGVDPEVAEAVAETRLATVAKIVERHGGALQQLLGAEIAAVFGAAHAHEDDALRAVRAAVAIRDALAGDAAEASFGVEAGEMLVGDGAPGFSGAAVNAARRLEGLAGPGEILLGSTALRLAAGAIEVVSPEVGVYRLLGVVERAPTVARRLDAPLVGRRDELAQLRAALDVALEGSRCVRLVVVGEPGKGKTRLATELLGSLGDDVLTLTGSCVPYGEGATYLPLREALATPAGAADLAAGISRLLQGEDDAALVVTRLAGAFSLEPVPTASSDVAWAVRRLLETLARQRPVVLALDDAHWAEPTLLDLVDYVAEWSADAPILLLCLGRPELLEERPSWASDAVVLGPLEADDARALVDALPERDEIADDAVEAVLAAGEGNPLFLEQLAVFAAEGELRERAVPLTVETLIAGRLDRLDRDERAMLEWAAVAGREFAREAVEELAPADNRAAVASTLLALVGRRLVRPERSAVGGEDAYRFEHVLVRDVAYSGIPKTVRAELHERLARWLDTRPDALDEVVGYHLEQAHRLKSDLGDEDVALAQEAGTRLGEAGRRAIFHLDHRTALGLLTRATSLTPTRDDFRFELGLALKDAGDLEQAVVLLSDCAKRARERGDRALELRVAIELAWPRLADASASTGEILELVRDAVPVFEAASDDYAVARAYHMRSIVEVGLRLRCAEAGRAAMEANERYRRAGVSLSCDVLLAQAWTFGPVPVPRAIEGCGRIYADPTTQRPILPYGGRDARWRLCGGRRNSCRRLRTAARFGQRVMVRDAFGIACRRCPRAGAGRRCACVCRNGRWRSA
jgi:DNA-binding SARP family transcriptional activator